jgi:tetratricopeptide (TPR) repeat protein
VDGYYNWNWQEAEARLTHALELSPSYETGHHLYAMGCLMPQARFEEALHQITLAKEISPKSPFIVTCVGIVNFYSRNYSKAMEEFDNALRIHPGYFLAHWHRGWVLAEWKRFEEAIEAVSRAVEMSNGSPQVLAALAQVCAVGAKIDRSREILNQLKQIASERYVSPYDLALVHISLGEDRKALELLRDAAEQRVPMLARLGVHPLFDRFRSNSQFRSLLRAVNLPLEPLVESKKSTKRSGKGGDHSKLRRKR